MVSQCMAGMVRIASVGRFSRVGAGMDGIGKVPFDWVSSGLDGEFLVWNGRRGLARTGELRKCRERSVLAGKERNVVALLVGLRTVWFG